MPSCKGSEEERKSRQNSSCSNWELNHFVNLSARMIIFNYRKLIQYIDYLTRMTNEISWIIWNQITKDYAGKFPHNSSEKYDKKLWDEVPEEGEGGQLHQNEGQLCYVLRAFVFEVGGTTRRSIFQTSTCVTNLTSSLGISDVTVHILFR